VFKEWNSELNQFLILVIIGGLGGWTLGYPGIGIALVTVPYCMWMLFRTRDLARWLLNKEHGDPPESSGVWGLIFDHLYQEQKASKEQITNLQNVIIRTQQSTNAHRDAVILVDQRGNLEWWNDAGTRLLGLRMNTDRGQLITNLLRDPRFIQYFESGNYQRPLDLPSGLRSNVILQYQITTFGRGERLVVARDVTRIHNLEQTRKDFVANVSHELRTPLTVIKGYLETLMDSLQEDHPHLNRGLARMQEQALRMEALVNDLLLLSRLETDTGTVEFKPVGVPRLLQRIHNDAQAMNEQKQHSISLEIDDNLDIKGDLEQLRSAFSNLVINAIKYSPPKSNLTVRWFQDDNGINMEVEDDGDGIDPTHLPRLTERFYRADQSRHSKTGGTGLGLAIVKHVLLHHGGELKIYSELGEGSVFTCVFPLKLRVQNHEKSVA